MALGVVAQHLRASTHLPHTLGTDQVVLVRVLVLPRLEPQLHVADGVVRLNGDGVEDTLAVEHEVALVLVVRVMRDGLDRGDILSGERHGG